MEAKDSGKSGAKPEAGPDAAKKRRLLLRGGIIALALIAGLIAWLATRDNGGGSPPEPAATEAFAPRIVTVAELREAAAKLGQPIYWAGPMPGMSLELTELAEGGVQVRYLPEGTEAGEASVESRTIGSYPLSDPTAAVDSLAKEHDSIVLHAGGGRKLVIGKQRPTSVYFASPDNSVQVEVYDPSPKKAASLAISSRVRPVG